MAGVPVGDTTLLAKLREQGVHTWERRIMGDGHPSMFSADITDEVVTLIEAAQRYTTTAPSVAKVKAHSDLLAALAPFVGEATQ